MTKQYKIAFMPGDGIGNDVLEASRAILDVADFNAEYIPLDIGFKIFEAEGDALPERTIEALKECDAALFGAIPRFIASTQTLPVPPPTSKKTLDFSRVFLVLLSENGITQLQQIHMICFFSF